MITGFEDVTFTLSKEEKEMGKEILQFLIRASDLAEKFKKVEKRFVKSKNLEKKFKIKGVRLRKIVNWVRRHVRTPVIIATSKGYCATTSLSEVGAFIRSMRERAEAIMEVADCVDRNIFPPHKNKKS
jgi:hypothetical protein